MVGYKEEAFKTIIVTPELSSKKKVNKVESETVINVDIDANTSDSSVDDASDSGELTTVQNAIKQEKQQIREERKLMRQRKKLARLERKEERILNRELNRERDMLTGVRGGKVNLTDESDEDLLIDQSATLSDRSLNFLNNVRPGKKHQFKKPYSHKPNAYNLEICDQNYNKYENNRGKKRRTLRG